MVQDNSEEAGFYVRVFPIEDKMLNRLGNELGGFSQTKRALPDGSGNNLVLKVEPDSDMPRLIQLIEGASLAEKVDVFISLVPLRDSIIKEVPRNVVQFISQFECRLFVSFTAGY